MSLAVGTRLAPVEAPLLPAEEEGGAGLSPNVLLPLMYSFMRCNWAWLSALDFLDSEIFLISHLSNMPSKIADVLETKS